MATLRWISLSRGQPAPKNMVRGGHGKNQDEALFVARGMVQGELAPGKFDGKRCIIPIDDWECELENFEVLVNEGNDALTWVRSRDGNHRDGAIIGGVTADGQAIFVGRVMHRSELICGKICDDVIYFGSNGREHHRNEYEVLVARFVTPPSES